MILLANNNVNRGMSRMGRMVVTFKLVQSMGFWARLVYNYFY